jgi:hypothetical protein
VQPVRRLGGGSLPFDLGPTAQDPTGNFTTGGQKGVSELFTGARPSLGIGETPSGVMSDWSGVEPPGRETPAGPFAPFSGAGDRGGFNPFEGMDDFRGMGPRTTWNMGPATIPGREGWSNPFYRRRRGPASPSVDDDNRFPEIPVYR